MARNSWRKLFALTFLLTLADSDAVQASCPAPQITVNPESSVVGGSFTISGSNFFVGCSDAVQCDSSDVCPSPQPEPPDKGIAIRFFQGDTMWQLKVVDAQPDFTFSVQVQVPGDASPGEAIVRVSGQNGTPSQPFQVLPASQGPEPSPNTNQALGSSTPSSLSPEDTTQQNETDSDQLLTKSRVESSRQPMTRYSRALFFAFAAIAGLAGILWIAALKRRQDKGKY